jgi:UDP-N-acetylmuramoyl-L-alanyl-D-glutamate--2,6-diaminopimelate ligase
MKLGELFEAQPGAAGVEISGLAYDSRRVRRGDLFFCVSGFESDGHDFAPQAVAAGAAALVVERPLALGVPEVVVDSARAAMAPAAARFYGDPSAQLPVVGVTGTNGKTTTAYLLPAMLAADGRQCGLIGTVKSVVAGAERKAARTTPEAIDIQRDLRAMLDGGDRACAMEVSSVGLALQRADAIHFAVALFTNLTPDHLDFHSSMDEYFAAKRRLFDAGPGVAIVNVDDPYGRDLAGRLDQAVTYALDVHADYRVLDLETTAEGSSFVADTPKGRLELRSPLPGRFNVYNVLGAVAAGHALGAGNSAIGEAVESTGHVPGRLEPIDEGQSFAVVIDYAHSPDSLENALGVLRERLAAAPGHAGRLICVFGATGSRFRETRREMGEVASRLADVLIVTSDNPALEDPDAIRDILAGAAGQPEAVPDRGGAIARAIELAEAADTVVIAGGEFPFEDVAIARRALRAAAAAHGQ